ncbi:hypothetical protein [Methylomonas rapida]|uniref:Tail assembly chaperone E/41/14-like protein n=1 Tax=Methylomonas rapida TaxID=2963939 RepID=A0ABY7GES8_9GAMM|nr:hypothetical protein [Methylomonas rapida]WAR42936.1 hypothetical protein NM686_011030 [Methylomonas rapida]
MRHSKTIELSEGRLATVQELRVKDARRLIANLTGVGLPDMLGDKFPEVVGLLGDCVQLPEGEDFDDFSLGDAKTIIDTFTEVNRDFFAMVGLEHLAPTPSNNSTSPVSA